LRLAARAVLHKYRTRKVSAVNAHRKTTLSWRAMSGSSGRAQRSVESEVDHGEPPPNLTGVVLGGVAWKATSHTVAEGSRVVVAIILARLLTPSDYGIAGMALVITSFVSVFADPSLGAALIQRPTISEQDRSTIFWTALGIGATLTAVGVALAGLVAHFFGEPQVRAIFMVTSLSFVLLSLAVVPRSLLVRRLAYRTLEIRDMTSRVVGGGVAILLAFAGAGPWAVVSNFLSTVVVSTVLLWLLVDWRPHFTYAKESLRNLGGFSSQSFGATMLSWGNLNLDNVLVGRVLGPAALGAYSLAYNVMFLPITRIGRPLSDVLSPAYSRIQGDRERLQRAWLRGKRMVVLLVVPGFLSMLVCAPDLIRVVFGTKWGASIVPLQLLCVAGLAHSLGMLNWGVLAASGKGGALLRLTLLTSFVTWTSFAIGLQWGIVGVAAAYATARWLLVLPEAWITSRAVSFAFRPTLFAGGAILPLGLGAAAVAVVVRELLVTMDVAPVLRIAAVVGTFLAAYVLLVRLALPGLVADVRATLGRRSALVGT
jgi:O-antigen/teichoic acid export membrane protein